MAKSRQRVRIFSALEVANICGVVNQTAINWIRNGHLKAFKTPGGQYRIYAKDLAAFLNKRGMSAPKEVLQAISENANWGVFMIAAAQPANDIIKNEIGKSFPSYSIIQAMDWFEVGRNIAEEKPGFVLLDTSLPGVDCVKFLHTVRDDPALGKPYVILLADGSYRGRENPSALADATLTKPLVPRELEAAIKALEERLEKAANA